MILKHLSAQNYRNIESLSLDFEKGVNLFFGENAQGKTNALECIYSFARGKSFRGTADKDLVRFGESWFRTEISFENREREQTLSYRYSDGDRERKRNGIKIDKLTEMIGQFRAVLFYPEHLQLVKGGPSERRSFLNIAISQCYPVYLKLYADYNRILENRNCLLKFAQKGMPCDANELASWSSALASVSASIYWYRKKYIERIAESADLIMRDITGGKESISLYYESDTDGIDEASLTDSYLRQFEENRSREIGAGCTLFGIHRDDLGIEINGLSARSFASQGQQRSIVLSLKLAEGEVSKEISSEYPVFLFDDVLSELDEKRRAYVLSDPGERQFILTACEMNGFDPHRVNFIPVHAGSFG